MSTISTPTKEVKLLKDDNWKLIQQNTFTRWVNQQLKQAVESPQIENLVSSILPNFKFCFYSKRTLLMVSS